MSATANSVSTAPLLPASSASAAEKASAISAADKQKLIAERKKMNHLFINCRGDYAFDYEYLGRESCCGLCCFSEPKLFTRRYHSWTRVCGCGEPHSEDDAFYNTVEQFFRENQSTIKTVIFYGQKNISNDQIPQMLKDYNISVKWVKGSRIRDWDPE